MTARESDVLLEKAEQAEKGARLCECVKLALEAAVVEPRAREALTTALADAIELVTDAAGDIREVGLGRWPA